MTVAATPVYAEFSWTGAETTFAPGIVAQDVSHIVVQYKDGAGAISTLANGLHVTLSKAGDPGVSGVVSAVPLSMPAAPGTLIFSRKSPDTQATPFVDLAKYSASTHEKLHDIAALRSAELRRDTGRSLKVPDTIADLPAAAARIGMVFVFDAAGNPRMAPPTADSTALAQSILDQVTVLAGSMNSIGSAVDLAAATIPASTLGVITSGYAARGDAPPAVWKRVAVQPTHMARARSTDRYLPNGTTDAANGGWWEMQGPRYDARNFGYKGDGAADETTALRNLATVPANSICIVPETAAYGRIATVTNDGTRNVGVTISNSQVWQIDGRIRQGIDPTVTAHCLFLVTPDNVKFVGAGSIEGFGTFVYNNGIAETQPGLIRVARVGTAWATEAQRIKGFECHIKLVDPPNYAVWGAFLHMPNFDGMVIEGGPSAGVVNVVTDVVHGILLDSTYCPSFRGCTARRNAAGGALVLFFEGLSIASTGGYGLFVEGCQFDGLWDKAVYTYWDGCVIDGNRLAGRGGGFGNGFRIGNYGIVTNNVGTNMNNGAVQVSQSSFTIVADNRFSECGKQPISLQLNSGDPAAAISEAIIARNIIYFDTTLSCDAGIIAQSTSGFDLTGVDIIDNHILYGDYSRLRNGAIVVQSGGGGGFCRRVRVKGNRITSPGRSGILVSDCIDPEIDGNYIENAGTSIDGYGIYLQGTINYPKIRNNEVVDTRGAGAVCQRAVIYSNGIGGSQTGLTMLDNIADGLTNANGYVLAAGPISGGYQVRGNRNNRTSPVSGTFIMPAAALLDLACKHAWSTEARLILEPRNAAAATLMNSTKRLLFNAAGTVLGTSIRVATADGANAVGTEQFYFEVVN